METEITVEKKHREIFPAGRSVSTWFFTMVLGSLGVMIERLFIWETITGEKIFNLLMLFFVMLFVSGIYTIPSMLLLWMIYSGIKKMRMRREVTWFYLLAATAGVNALVIFFISESMGMSDEIQELLIPYVMASFIVVIWLNRKILFGLPLMSDKKLIK